MADKRTDSTRELIADAEQILSEREHSPDPDRLVDEAQALLDGKKPDATRDLIASSEELIQKRKPASQGASWLIWVVVAAIAGAAAVFLLT